MYVNNQGGVNDHLSSRIEIEDSSDVRRWACSGNCAWYERCIKWYLSFQSVGWYAKSLTDTHRFNDDEMLMMKSTRLTQARVFVTLKTNLYSHNLALMSSLHVGAYGLYHWKIAQHSKCNATLPNLSHLSNTNSTFPNRDKTLRNISRRHFLQTKE